MKLLHTVGPLGLVALCLLSSCSLVGDLYEVRAKPRKYSKPVMVEFVGGKGLDRSSLADRIKDSIVDFSKEQQPSSAFDAQLELEDLFVEKGHAFVKIEHEVTKDKEGRDLIRFTIDEGPLCLVRSFEVSGNKYFDGEQIKELWSRTQTGVFGMGLSRYVLADLQGLVDATTGRYRQFGFLDAKAELRRKGPTRTDPEARIDLVVTEGPSYTYRKIEVAKKVLDALGDDRPQRQLEPGDTFSDGNTYSYLGKIVRLLREKGYPDPKLRSKATLDRKEHRVDITIEGEPGVVATVRSVRVEKKRGYVRESGIRDRMPLKPGMQFKGSLEDQGVQQLYRSGLFAVAQTERSLSEDGKDLDLKLKVLETERFEINPQVGYGAYQGPIAGLGFLIREIPLLRTDFRVRGTVSSRGHRLNASFIENEFLDGRTTLVVSGDTFKREQPAFVDKSQGVAVTVSRTVFKRTTATAGYVLRDHRNDDIDVNDPLNANSKDYLETSLFSEISQDHRDSVLLPRRGYRWRMNLRIYDPTLGGDLRFIRFRLDGTGLVRLRRNMQAVFNTRQSLIFALDGSADMPVQERLFVGGENTVRSFKQSELGPKDNKNDPIGGEFSNVFNAELRWQPFTLLELAGFVDAGNVGRRVEDYSLGNIDFAVGAGIRWLLPIGPVRFDAAWNMDRDASQGEDAYQLFISVGYPF